MLVLEFKAKAKPEQYQAIDETIRIGQFIRNKCIRYWMDAKKGDRVNKAALSAYTKVIKDNPEYPWVDNLNSMARQACSERSWASIQRSYDNCKKSPRAERTPLSKGGRGDRGYPQFKKFSRSVEYKTSGWKLSDCRNYLTITDQTGIGCLKLKGSRDLHFLQKSQIKRIRIVKRADGYYVQFCIKAERNEDCTSTGNALGIDVGLESFYTDSNGSKVENPRFLRKSEKKLKRLQKRLSRKQKGSSNRKKAQRRLAKKHLQVSRQRKDFAVKTARCVMKSNDFVAIEKLNIKGFFLQPAILLKRVALSKQRIFCPEALIPVCPTVFKPLAKILIAAL